MTGRTVSCSCFLEVCDTTGTSCTDCFCKVPKESMDRQVNIHQFNRVDQPGQSPPRPSYWWQPPGRVSALGFPPAAASQEDLHTHPVVPRPYICIYICNSGTQWSTMGLLTSSGCDLYSSTQSAATFRIHNNRFVRSPFSLLFCFHFQLVGKITESQNGLGWKGPQGSWISNLPARQGHQPPHLLDQEATTRLPRVPSNLALNTSEHLQGWGTHSLSGQLFQHAQKGWVEFQYCADSQRRWQGERATLLKGEFKDFNFKEHFYLVWPNMGTAAQTESKKAMVQIFRTPWNCSCSVLCLFGVSCILSCIDYLHFRIILWIFKLKSENGLWCRCWWDKENPAAFSLKCEWHSRLLLLSASCFSSGTTQQEKRKKRKQGWKEKRKESKDWRKKRKESKD